MIREGNVLTFEVPVTSYVESIFRDVAYHEDYDNHSHISPQKMPPTEEAKRRELQH